MEGFLLMDKSKLISDLEAHANVMRYEVETAQLRCTTAQEMKCWETAQYEEGYAQGLAFAVKCLVNLMELHGIEI
jgi:hypothetical protein